MGIYAILVDSHNLKVKENGQLDYWNGTVDCILVGYSPRKRGLSGDVHRDGDGSSLFPAQAGVIHGAASLNSSVPSIPRASGDYPRGYPLIILSFRFADLLFPAQAGVIPVQQWINTISKAIPRASGGYPSQQSFFNDYYSPRKRGLSRASYHRGTASTIPRASGGYPECSFPVFTYVPLRGRELKQRK